MIGRKLTQRLVRDGRLGNREIAKLTLHDVVQPAVPPGAGMPVDVVGSDFADAGVAARLVAARPDVLFCLAAIVSGEAEENFHEGYRVNLDGLRFFIDANTAV